jgi:hypothetical protein
MGCTACTEPQCLYKGDLYLYLQIVVKYVWKLLRKISLENPNFFNPLNAELNSICHLLALLGAQPIFHVGRIRVKIGQKYQAIYITT